MSWSLAVRLLGPRRCGQLLGPIYGISGNGDLRLSSSSTSSLLSQPASRLASSLVQRLRFCVVGSGPAGFYAATQLLKRFPDAAEVDIVDRLPTPFGLVRSGVAPDHPNTKNVINQYQQLLENARVSFLGNVTVGKDISLQALHSHYNAVILAQGAESNRPLNIKGEGLAGVLSAREFVWWYNGHPDCCGLPIDLTQVERVAICGMGNVALDCARVLLQPAARLGATDVAAHALRQLRASAVSRVDVFGRRGPVQASFTAKELREMIGMEGVRPVINPDDLHTSEADAAEMGNSRIKKRVHEILTKAAGRPSHGEPRELHFNFLRSPVEALSNGAGRVRALCVERNRLEPGLNGRQRPIGTGKYVEVPADLVLGSIGYTAVPLEGAPFDAQRGVIPNRAGRVLEAVSQQPVPGLYVCGWVKRGPTGIIGTNLTCAEETVAAVKADEAALPAVRALEPGREGVLAALHQQGVQVVSADGWQMIDAEEQRRGEAVGKPREKLVGVHEMLECCA